jgi:hypothetical protein
MGRCMAAIEVPPIQNLAGGWNFEFKNPLLT